MVLCVESSVKTSVGYNGVEALSALGVGKPEWVGQMWGWCGLRGEVGDGASKLVREVKLIGE